MYLIIEKYTDNSYDVTIWDTDNNVCINLTPDKVILNDAMHISLSIAGKLEEYTILFDYETAQDLIDRGRFDD